ncbi:ArgS-related anticodon-binding protein NrtL [Streptomyces sp. NPDC086766]|uniref:ArgS-related anticodon-binding protein NrtL n=1 Tax=Streptomyces sp. NPDC086766 TaxID=3365754 RepID=UPI003810D1B7
MTPVELSRTVLGAVRRAVEDGELRVAVPERALVTVPGPGGCGDYATNVALQLARPAGEPPLRVAEILRTRLVGLDGITDVTVTGPGFLNISLRSSASTRLVEEILRRGPRYGHADQLTGQLYQLHCPQDVRAVVVTDVVARLLRSQGALLRSSCEGPPLPAWEAVLGVDLDLWRRSGDPPSPLDVNIRPVPAPADPVPLGRDAGRWALLHPGAHDRPRIGDQHLVQRESNPLFRVRYACARTRALSRNAADLGFSSQPGPLVSRATTDGTAFEPPASSTSDTTSDADVATFRTTSDADVATFRTPSEPTAVPAAAAVLLTALADHPRVLAQAAAHRAPDRLARHLVSVADAVLPFLPGVLPLGEEKPSAAHRARLALAEAAGAVLAGGLSLFGIDAPEHL